MSRHKGKQVEEILINLYNQIKGGNIDVPTFVEKVSYLINKGTDILSGFSAKSLKCRNQFLLGGLQKERG